MKAYGQAVHYYTKASHLLEQYQHIQSFEGIRQDCEKIMKDLSRILQSRLDESEHRVSGRCCDHVHACMHSTACMVPMDLIGLCMYARM